MPHAKTSTGTRKPRSTSSARRKSAKPVRPLSNVDNGPDFGFGIDGSERGAEPGAGAGPEPTPGPIGGGGTTELDLSGTPSLDTPSASSILAPLATPQSIGEIVSVLSDALADALNKHRSWLTDMEGNPAGGEHLRINETAAAAAIGVPVHAWTEKLSRRQLELAERTGSSIAIGIGLLSIGLPIVLGEYRIWKLKNDAQRSLAQPNPQTPYPGGSNGVPPAANGAAGAGYGGRLGFADHQVSPNGQAHDASPLGATPGGPAPRGRDGD